MTVNFKFDYVLNLHNREIYISSIERNGETDDIAFKRSLVQVNRNDIKSILKSPDGAAIVIFKMYERNQLKTIEEYDEIVDAIQKANIALDIMQQEKVYIFDNFEVDNDELNIVSDWRSTKKD